MKSESSPASKNNWSWFKTLSTAMAAFTLLIFGMIRSIGPSNMLKLCTGSQLIISYIVPQLMISKRGAVSGGILTVPVPPIIEIFPTPLHLIVTFGDSTYETELERIDNSVTQITNRIHLFNGTVMPFNLNSSTVFETLAFSLCESFAKNRRYPTKVLVIGPPKSSSCVLGKYRWALKIPKEIISFRPMDNGSEHIYGNFSVTCSETKSDPFDCDTPNRQGIRIRVSQMCPEMSPFLLACINRNRLERALAYNPPWSSSFQR